MTGLPGETRQGIFQRARFACELCGKETGLTIHHRRPRQMGGTSRPDIHWPSNLLAVCGSGTTGCHGHIESQRERSYHYGWLVRTGFSSEETPFCDMKGRWFLLLDDGRKMPLRLPEP